MSSHTIPCPVLQNLRPLQLTELSDLQDPSKPNPLDQLRPHSADYHKVHHSRQQLPVYPQLPRIGQAIVESQVVVLNSPTGSGKSTQVPQYCALMLNQAGCDGTIYVTQPRQVATSGTGERLQVEFDSPNVAGYQYQGNRSIPDPDLCAVTVMTAGTLEQILKGDENLADGAMVILDEVHELSQEIEILLGCLYITLKKRPDLKLVLMSATGDVTAFMSYFEEFAPREIQLEGKPQQLHKVYLAPEERETSYEVMILAALGRIYDTPILGDVLVFLPGEAPILQIRDQIVGLHESEEFRDRVGLVEVLVLYRDVPIKEQSRITTDKFDAQGNRYRKIILATNIAETSITIENLVIVIDAGQNKMNIFDHAHRGSELLPVPNSQAQSDQRAGRAGRRQEGICIFCYTRDEYTMMPVEAPRPLTRADLTLFVLKVLAQPSIKGDLTNFRWFTKPEPHQLAYALGRLGAYGFLEHDSPTLTLTGEGRTAATLDIEPELATLLMAVRPVDGVLPSSVHEVLVLLALRSVGSISKMTGDDQDESRAARDPYTVPESEHLSEIILWLAWEYNYRTAHGLEFAKAMYLHQGQCRKVKQRLRALRRTYEGIYNVKVPKFSKSTEPVTTKRFQELLWSSHILNRAVLHNPIPPSSSREQYTPTWKSTISHQGRFGDERLLLAMGTQLYKVKPAYVVFSEIRLRRLSGDRKLQIMDMVTLIPLGVVKADPSSSATIPPIVYAERQSGKRKRSDKP